jgi:voltage-gated potassium channel
MAGRNAQPRSLRELEPTPVYSTPRLETWQRWTEAPLLVLAIGSLPLLLLEVARQDLTYGDRIFLDIFNILVLVAFAVDYIVELVLASPRPAFVRHEWTSPLIVISQMMALIPGLAATGSLRALRAGRAFRATSVLFRLLAIGGASAREGRTIIRKHAARFALAFAGLTWITAAVGFALAEGIGEHHRVHSFFDAIWWSASTITTVGYGDIAPVTVAGKLIGMATMVIGVGAFAVVTAKVAEFLVRSGREDTAAESATARPLAAAPSAQTTGLIDELATLVVLHEHGELSDDEFSTAKARLLAA